MSDHRFATSSRPAFTLIEMVTSLVILSVLLLACASIVGMATRATSDGSVRNQTQLQSADAAAQITDDLNMALNFTERTPTATTFTVPDRLSAGTPQTVRYNWAGTTGAPLTRQFNGGTATTLLPGVQKLNLSFLTRTMGPVPGPTEQVIFSHDTVIGTAKDYVLDNKNWASQYFTPSLPLGTSSYTITRIRLMLKVGTQSMATNVSVRMPTGLFKPSSTVLASTTVYQSALSSGYEWIDVPFTGLTGLNPLQGLCIVLKNETGSTNIGSWQIDQSLFSILSGADWSTTTNSGSSWSFASSTTTARFYVLGTVP